MPTKTGIQGREGMDTGFRRYDGNFVNSSPDRLCTYFRSKTRFAVAEHRLELHCQSVGFRCGCKLVLQYAGKESR